MRNLSFYQQYKRNQPFPTCRQGLKHLQTTFKNIAAKGKNAHNHQFHHLQQRFLLVLSNIKFCLFKEVF